MRKTLFFQCFFKVFETLNAACARARKMTKEERRKKKEERRKKVFFLLVKRRPSFFFLLSSFKKKTFFLLSSFFFLLSSFGMCGQPGPGSGMWAHGVMYGCLERVRQCAIAFVMVCQCFRVPICFREPAEGNQIFPIGFIRPSRLLVSLKFHER